VPVLLLRRGAHRAGVCASSLSAPALVRLVAVSPGRLRPSACACLVLLSLDGGHGLARRRGVPYNRRPRPVFAALELAADVFLPQAACCWALIAAVTSQGASASHSRATLSARAASLHLSTPLLRCCRWVWELPQVFGQLVSEASSTPPGPAFCFSLRPSPQEAVCRCCLPRPRPDAAAAGRTPMASRHRWRWRALLCG